MTLNNFMQFCESYYGEKYNAVTGAVMRDYMADASETYLDAAAKVLTLRITRSYKIVPGPAEIEKLHDEIMATMPSRKRLSKPVEKPVEKMTEEQFAQLQEVLNKLRVKHGYGDKANPLQEVGK